jgi:hypothetical protein
MPAKPLSITLAAVVGGALLLGGCSSDEEPVAPGAAPTASASPTVTEEAKAEEPATDGPYAGLDNKQILTLMSETTEKATSVRVKADLDQNGEKVTLNTWMNRKGRAEGELSTESEGSMTMILVGEKGWLKPGQEMLGQITGGDPAVEDYMAGKWLPFSKDDPDMADQFELMNMDAFFTDLITPGDLEGEIVQVKGKKFGKRAGIGIKRKGESGTLYVAADGSGELLAYTDKSTRMRFTEWNSKHKVKKPDNVLEDAQLAQGA